MPGEVEEVEELRKNLVNMGFTVPEPKKAQKAQKPGKTRYKNSKEEGNNASSTTYTKDENMDTQQQPPNVNQQAAPAPAPAAKPVWEADTKVSVQMHQPLSHTAGVVALYTGSGLVLIGAATVAYKLATNNNNSNPGDDLGM